MELIAFSRASDYNKTIVNGLAPSQGIGLSPTTNARRTAQFFKLASLALIACLVVFARAPAAVHYVDASNAVPVSPYTDWSTAATNIQDAINAASAGELVLVTNGTYRFGGKTVSGENVSRRAVVDKPLTLLSVNGPQQTLIVGVPGLRGSGACAYVTNGAILSGFTLTNGSAVDQGVGNGSGAYCAGTNALVTNCVVIGNSAGNGAGVYSGTIVNCIIRSNTATSSGGGAYLSNLKNCEISGNRAGTGAGVASVAANNCAFTGNSAASAGGGAWQSVLNNSILWFNTAPSGSNFSGGSLNYCCTAPLPDTGAGNISLDPQLAGPGRLSTASPCRQAGSSSLATGLDLDGESWLNPPSIGCDELYPQNVGGPLSVAVVADATNAAIGWPINFAAYVSGKASAGFWNFGDGTTITNEPYASHAWATGGLFNVSYTVFNQDNPAGVSATWPVSIATQTIFYVSVSNAAPAAPYSSWETAANDIQSALDLTTVSGQVVIVSNGLYQTGGRINGPGSTTNRVVVARAVRLISLNGPSVTIIQGQRASGGGGLGPDAVRCVYLASGATLDGFTLMNGSTASFDDGGGVYCLSTSATITNCIFHANYAYLGAGLFYGTANNCYLEFNASYAYGGGGYQTIFNNCTLYDNVANFEGGGASYGTLNNCTLNHCSAANRGGGVRYSTVNNSVFTYNTSDNGGGAYQATLNNCSLYFNYGYVSAGGTYQCTLKNCINYGNGSPSGPNTVGDTLNYCCTTPLPASGVGNISSPPMFVSDVTTNIDLHLQPGSPCINSGRNLYVIGSVDADSLPRIAGGTVDMGAYEFQTPTSRLSYAWAQSYGLPVDGSADFADPDADGLSNWQEWLAGTNPTNAASTLKMFAPVIMPPSAAIVSWSSVTNRTYALEFASAPTSAFTTIITNIVGKNGTTTVTNVGPPAAALFRVRVEP